MYKIKPKSVMVENAFSDMVGCLNRMMFDPHIHHAMIICGPLIGPFKKRVQITRVRGRDADFVLTVGRPNWREREYLKLCKKAKCNPRRWKTWGFR